MSQSKFFDLLNQEVARIDAAGSTKRKEKIIEKFTKNSPPKAVIAGKEYFIFNSNDYLSLKYHPELKKGEEEASAIFGTGPGAVRFISGSLKVNRDLEKKAAAFHQRDDAIVYSSAFAANQGAIFPLIAPQVKTSLMQDKVFVVSDELNHRSIIDAIRLANLPKEQRAIFKHLNFESLREILSQALGKFDRVAVITDGVFSMLGELQNLKELEAVKTEFDDKFPHGVITIVDDAHGVGAIGKTGRGTEEIFNVKVDVLTGTFGKAFGSDGGYVVGSQAIIDYLRESSATYIYSNSVSPGTAGASLAALELLEKPEGKSIMENLAENTRLFKALASEANLPFAAESNHPIQPVLIGDTQKSKRVVAKLFELGFLATAINYPVVPPNRDEIRVQINANHTKEALKELIAALKTSLKE